MVPQLDSWAPIMFYLGVAETIVIEFGIPVWFSLWSISNQIKNFHNGPNLVCKRTKEGQSP